MRQDVRWAIVGLLCLGVIGCHKADNKAKQPATAPEPEAKQPAKAREPEARFGTRFFPGNARFTRPPKFTDIPVPDFVGAMALWGATGRNDAGDFFFGVSSHSVPNASARLLRLSPNAAQPEVLGDVLAQLKLAGRLREGESQMKIHGKICQADDGYLYFASLDENGEQDDGSVYPTWGGHLWRMKPDGSKWEHLLATKEGLIAVATSGRYVYALGYFNQVLYRYDVATSEVKSVTVGSVAGHLSRLFLVDLNGHAYVSRITEVPSTGPADPAITRWDAKSVRSTLVEFDSNLQELQSWPLPDYDPTPDTNSHGIVGYAMLASGNIVFTTHSGALWRIQPSVSGPTTLERLGWYHPQGRSYTTTLYCPTGRDFICGVSQPPSGKFEWVIYDLTKREAKTVALDKASQALLERENLLIYGTNTLDNKGRAYLVGWITIPRGFGPHIMRVEWPAGEYEE